MGYFRGTTFSFLRRLMNLNIGTDVKEVVTPDFIDISSSGFSPLGQTIVFIAKPSPDEKRNIYFAHKK